MKRGWLGILPALLLLALYAGVAGAQGGEKAATDGGEQAAPPTPNQSGGLHTSQQFGFSIALPGGGTLLTPESGSAWPWPKDPSAAFHWYGVGAVKEVIVHCYKFQAPVSEATFGDFKKSLLDSFMALDKAKEEAKEKDKAAKVKEAVGVVEKKSFVIGDETGGRNTLLMADDGSRWNRLAIKDQRHEEAPLGYTILSTYGGDKIYSVTLIYTSELNDSINKVGADIVNSLSAPDSAGPFGIEPVAEVAAPASAAGAPAASKS